MKLAEALIERKSLMEKVETLRNRVMQNVQVQEGDTPAEQPAELMAQIRDSIVALEAMIKRINRTNNTAQLQDGTSVSEAIVHRDMLNLQRSAVEMAANTAMMRQNRISRGEIKFVSTINPVDLRKEVDTLAKAHRELDAQIQAVNWSADLME